MAGAFSITMKGLMRLRQKRKRMLALLLAVALALSMVPCAFAEEAEALPEAWQAISDALPEPITGYDANDPGNPYPYGLPVDTFDEADLVESDSNGIMLLAENGQGSIPDEMWDNTILRALEYTGFNLQYLKDRSLLYKYEYTGSRLKTNAPSVLSDIGYWSSGTCPNGDETVSDSGTVTGLAPNIARFEQYGLVCASFVTYYLCNYLPNIEGVDTTHIYEKAKEIGVSGSSYYLTTVATWKNTLDELSAKSGGGVTKYTDADEAYENLVPGDVIVFTRDGKLVHVSIYAGAYTYYRTDGSSLGTYHFVVHVGNSRGPEISTVEGTASAGNKSSYPAYWYHLDINDAVDSTGFIEINKKDTSGNALAGAYFTATDQSTGDQYVIGPTNSSGYAKSGELPLGTYMIRETVFPTGYEASGQMSWTVTISASTPNMTITINAVNKLITGSLKIQKATNTGANLSGWSFGVYTDTACTKAVSGSPFTTGSTGSVTVTGLVPGTYYVKELTGSSGYWVCDNEVKTVKVTANTTSTVTVTNTQLGRAKIIKSMPDGGSVAGWAFEVYRVSDNSYIGTFTTGAGGTILTGYLEPGQYRVTEKVPEDSIYYCETANPQTVTVTAGQTAAVTFTNRIKPGKITVQKVDTTGTTRAGAEFLLEWSEDGVNWSPVVYSESVTKGGCSSAGLSDGRLTSGTDGLVTFEGLHPELQYRLTETMAPDGLQLLTDYAYEGGLSVEQELTVSLTVVNVPVFTLPETGSHSFITMALALCLCLTACAGACFILRRKEQ